MKIFTVILLLFSPLIILGENFGDYLYKASERFSISIDTMINKAVEANKSLS